jgi:hypothetical protein
MATAIDAKGDLIVGTGADTFARLSVGTNGYTLVADSAEATGLKWAAAAGGGGGKVLQVVNATYSTQVSTSTNTFVDTGLTASITPSLVSSKVLVFVSQSSVGKSAANAGTYGALKLVRGATDLVNFETQFAFTNTTLEQGVAAASTTYLDSPATTSSTTYKTQVKSAGNTSAVLVQQGTSTSTITLMEIGA